MRVLLIMLATLCYACGNFPQANNSNVGVAATHHGVSRALRLAQRVHVSHTKESFINVCATLCAQSTLQTVRRITAETSALSLDKKLADLHTGILISRHKLELLITKMDNKDDILRLNAKFQKAGNILKEELGHTAEDNSLQLGVDLDKVTDPKLAKSILKRMQEINTMLSTPLHSVKKVLDN